MTLKDAIELMEKLGFKSVAVASASEADAIAAILFAEDERTLRRVISNPELWEIWSAK